MIIAAAALLTTGFLYDSSRAQGELSTVSLATNTDVANQDFLNALNKYKSMDLSLTIYGRDDYKALRDRSEPINPEPVGRKNPFAPFVGGATSDSNVGNINFSSTNNGTTTR